MRWGTAASLSVATAAVALLGAPPSEGQPEAKAVRMHSLSPGDTAYVLLGGGGHSLAVVHEASGGVVLVDTKSAGWGPTIMEAVALVTELPVTTIINTHAHADHVGSNAGFPAAARIIAHENALAGLEQAPAFAAAGRSATTFSGRLSLFEGANRIELYHFGPAHTDGDTVVVFPDKGVVHVGDLINARAAPFIDTANGGSGVAYPQTLAKLVAGIDGVDSVITGHGMLPPVPGVHGMLQTMTWADVQEYAAFNRDFLAAVREAMDSGKDAAEAAATLRMPVRYAGYGMEQAEANVRIIYDELRPGQPSVAQSRVVPRLFRHPAGTAANVTTREGGRRALKQSFPRPRTARPGKPGAGLRGPRKGLPGVWGAAPSK